MNTPLSILLFAGVAQVAAQLYNTTTSATITTPAYTTTGQHSTTTSSTTTAPAITSSSIPSTTPSTTTTTPSTTTTSSYTSTTPYTSSYVSSTSRAVATSHTSSSAVATPTGSQLHTTTSNSLSGGAIAGIVVGSVAGVAIIGFLAFCCLKKRRKQIEDEDYMKGQNYVDNQPYDMQTAVGDAPVSAFSPAAAYRQYNDYADPAEQNAWAQQGAFTRERSLRYPVESYGANPHAGHYDNPNMPEGGFIGLPSEKCEDPSNYHNPNTPSRGPSHTSQAGMPAAAFASMAYGHGEQNERYEQQDMHGQGSAQDQIQYARYQQPHEPDAQFDPSGHFTYEGSTTVGSATAGQSSSSSSPPQQAYTAHLPPPHGLDKN